ncbi:MAG: HAD-IA family hydrolase [Deltaproteobacteria bacterium]|nr:HAD-IA family hydrolase [Deltaproteobacteria bacterium]MBN2674442.1 HAD-IA family hydrolase [Deltaproteobacteria bacterium]
MVEQDIQGIIFDLDGTLYSMRFMKMKMTFLLMGTIGFLRNLFAARAFVRRNAYENQDQLLRAMYDELASKTGKTAVQAEQWFQGAFRAAFIRLLARGTSARSGLVSLLNCLNQKNIKLAVISDFDWVSSRLEALQIPTQLFDTLRCSEEFGVLKPAPKPFLEVAAQWNLSPNQVLVVGDRADRDGECAKNAGMSFLGITDKREKRADFYCWNDAREQIRARTNCGEFL